MKGAKALEQEEIELISSKLKLRDRCLFITGIRTGFRISELLSINIEDVIDDKGEIKKEIKVKKKNTKGKIEGRIMPLHNDARDLIKQYLIAVPGQSGPLFRSKMGRRIIGRLDQSVFNKALKLAAKKSNINSDTLSSHTMRKSFAKKIYEALGQDIHKLQKAMGHRNLSSTASYLQVNWDEIAELIRNLK